jgi:hypothetical protein
MIKFNKWLENRVRGVRAISDYELDQVLRGEPYTSPKLGRIGFVPKDVDDKKTPGYYDYFRFYTNLNKKNSRKSGDGRSWIIDLEIPEDEAIERAKKISKNNSEIKSGQNYAGHGGIIPSALDALDPKHVKKIRRVRDNPDEEKLRDAEKFTQTFKRLFPSFESYFVKRNQ